VKWAWLLSNILTRKKFKGNVSSKEKKPRYREFTAKE
jgi:hypothetical protein